MPTGEPIFIPAGNQLLDPIIGQAGGTQDQPIMTPLGNGSPVAEGYFKKAFLEGRARFLDAQSKPETSKFKIMGEL